MKPLDRRQISFKMDEITYLDRKTIFLDRMLLGLFERLRFDGRKVVHHHQRSFDVAGLADRMANDPARFPGFAGQQHVAEAWLRSDLLDIMNRGKKNETMVGPRPFHLNAFKAANSKAVVDWGASAQVWAMLYHADRELLAELRSFFGHGLDFERDQYDGVTELDLETLAVLGIVDGISISKTATPAPEPLRPLCLAQGRILAADLRRILAYEAVIPRLVLAGYCRTILGLHLALYQLRLIQLIPRWVTAARQGSPADACSADAAGATIKTCPYALRIALDVTGNVASSAGLLARASADEHLAGIPDYVRSVLLLNRLRDFAETQSKLGKLPPTRTVGDLLEVLRHPPAEMEGYFEGRISDALGSDQEDETEDPIVLDLLRLPGTSLDKYVELICLKRMRQEHSQLVRLIDALGQKNRAGGLLRQNPGVRAPRWFSLDSHLLEALVHVALIDGSPGAQTTRPMLLRDFLEWLYERYGFEIYAPSHRSVLPEEQEGWQMNEAGFRERLHQIGFFTDLSDAHNSQTLRPRYLVTNA